MENPANIRIYLLNIYNKCKRNYWLHNETYYYLYRIHIIIQFIIICLNTGVAVLNSINISDTYFTKIIKYLSTIILLSNTFFMNINSLLKIDKKLEYHKNKASSYIMLSNEVEEYIMIGEQLDIITKIYKNYMSVSGDNEYVIPEFIIKKASKHLNQNTTGIRRTMTSQTIDDMLNFKNEVLPIPALNNYANTENQRNDNIFSVSQPATPPPDSELHVRASQIGCSNTLSAII
jgi:hypothetical protein